MIKYDTNTGVYFSTKINSPQIYSTFGTKKLKATENNQAVIDFCKENNIDAKLVYRPEQTHSTKVKVLEELEDTAVEEGDGVVTDEKNIALVVRTADCVPIIFVDKKTGRVGISHQGWRGTFEEMVKVMVENFQKKGTDKADLFVAIGPSIGLCCFEVKEDVFSKFKTKFEKYRSIVTAEREEKLFINLMHLNYLLLLETGLQKDQIDFFPFCTLCNSEQFFSYRRDYKTNYAQFGQQLSFIIKR